MQPVFFVEEFFSALGTFWNDVMMVVSRVMDQFLIGLELFFALVTRVIVTTKEFQLAISYSIS